MRAKDQNLFSSKRNIFLLILHPFLTWVFRLQEFTIEFITKFSHNSSICCYAYRNISKYWYWIIITHILSEEMLIPGKFYSFFPFPVCEESPGICSFLLTVCSILMIVVTLPFSLLYTVKVVQVIIFLCNPINIVSIIIGNAIINLITIFVNVIII